MLIAEWGIQLQRSVATKVAGCDNADYHTFFKSKSKMNGIANRVCRY
ncbi:MAG: hypothetical protein JWR87_2596 [Segetibacter sp.]|jgi:hypothetical protein|nr:hypothetical protein [Segetibacter sp.]